MLRNNRDLACPGRSFKKITSFHDVAEARKAIGLVSARLNRSRDGRRHISKGAKGIANYSSTMVVASRGGGAAMPRAFAAFSQSAIRLIDLQTAAGRQDRKRLEGSGARIEFVIQLFLIAGR
jgi:hypothetical protein